MATTLTNMTETKIIDRIVASLKSALIPAGAFALEVDASGHVQNDVLRVPVVTSGVTAQVKTPGTALTPNGAVATQPVTLSNLYEAVWNLNEAQCSAERVEAVFSALAAEASYAVAKTVIDSATALVTAANVGSDAGTDVITVPPADFGQNDLGALLAAAEAKKLGRERALVLNAAYAAALVGESNLGLVLATLGDQALKTAVLPPLLGMSTYMWSGLGDNSENLGGFVVDKGCIAVALAPPQALAPAGGGDLITAEIITDPDARVSALYKRWYDSGAGTVYGSIAVLYGVAFVSDHCVRIASA